MNSCPKVESRHGLPDNGLVLRVPQIVAMYKQRRSKVAEAKTVHKYKIANSV